MHPTESTYTLSLNKPNLVRAIIKYNANCFITSVDGVETNCPVSEINRYLSKDRTTKITVTAIMENLSAAGSLPALDPVYLQQLAKTPLAGYSHDIETISAIINHALSGQTSYRNWPEISSMDLATVYGVLVELSKSFQIEGIVHNESWSSFTFQCGLQFFSFLYGYATVFTPIPLQLDLEQGYLFSGGGTSYIPLRRYFVDWKGRDYTGELFPADACLALIAPTPKTIPKETTSCFSFFKRHNQTQPQSSTQAAPISQPPLTGPRYVICNIM